MESCVLFANADKSVFLIDVPRSIEEAQVLPDERPGRRILSSPALEAPWQAQAHVLKQPDITQTVSVMISELMTQETVRDALEEIHNLYTGQWCLPRVFGVPKDQSTEKGSRKRKEQSQEHQAQEIADQDPSPYIPVGSHPLLGSIESLRERFLTTAPTFDLIVLDPPWPNRSVRRKRQSYKIAYDMKEVEDLLSLIPVASHLSPEGLVAVWVTNKSAVLELLTSSGGMLAKWGLEPIGEFIWVKITSSGAPVVGVESHWKKPWERLVIARKKGSHVKWPCERRVVLGVPDHHSRKPNLRALFAEILPTDYRGLEVFARNLTAGWWSWGDQALLFQQRHHWLQREDT